MPSAVVQPVSASCSQGAEILLLQTLFYCLQCQTPQPGMCQHCRWEHDRSHTLLQVPCISDVSDVYASIVVGKLNVLSIPAVASSEA